MHLLYLSNYGPHYYAKERCERDDSWMEFHNQCELSPSTIIPGGACRSHEAKFGCMCDQQWSLRREFFSNQTGFYLFIYLFIYLSHVDAPSQ